MTIEFLKGSKLYSILRGVCPVCHQESMYKERNAYRIQHTLEMHERCGHCGSKYKIEPSFFYGAMYVSYPVGIGIAAVAFATAYLGFELGLLSSFLVIVATLITCLPLILRISRNIWINLFMSYKKPITRNDL